MLSPQIAGHELTRKSIGEPSTENLMRPSCGIRRSEMLIPAINLMRAMTELCSFFGMGGVMSMHEPSIRKRRRTDVFIGSM